MVLKAELEKPLNSRLIKPENPLSIFVLRGMISNSR
jgi:hypothetical protein